MHGIFALGALLLLFCTACQSPTSADAPDWPRVSFEARLLNVPQEWIDEFDLDDDGRVLQRFDDERSDWSRTIDQSTIELMLNAAQAHENVNYLLAPRVIVADHRVAWLAFEFNRGFEFVGSDGYADSDFEARLRKVELGLACDPLVAEATGCANVSIEVRFVGHLESKSRVYKPFVLDLWPRATKSFSAPLGETWLISLPTSQIQEATPDAEDHTRRYLLLIRPVLLQSKEHEDQIFPGLVDDANAITPG